MDIKSMTLTELTEYIVAKGYPKFRAKQIYEWCHVKVVRDVNEMNNLPKDIREDLKEDFISLEIVER
ncbi:MAG: 23S rRNA (adenine(2503)-C(2))-methyltransferase RlmN, partial [Lachnospiraceae bacterium]|nr:23S rRNA (adenine(2503)-C(2))-methyltransferase RlmN [Lachnospiraceae bacterium]